MTTRTLILIRHGESLGNAEGIFTGLLDVPLTERGRTEARGAAELLVRAMVAPSVALVSLMDRARSTLDEMLEILPHQPVVLADWRLNERHYGALSGFAKSDILTAFGEDQFLEWRRSIDIAPPAHPDGLPVLTPGAASPFEEFRGELGASESLRDVMRRVEPCFREVILPALHRGEVVAVIAHGNSLRALCAVIDALNDAEVRDLNLPTGQPLVYKLDADGRPAVRGGTYLDPDNALAAARIIAAQGGT